MDGAMSVRILDLHNTLDLEHGSIQGGNLPNRGGSRYSSNLCTGVFLQRQSAPKLLPL